MVHKFRNHFLAKFLIAFHVMGSILFVPGVLAPETAIQMVEILQQPIRNFFFKRVFEAPATKRITPRTGAWNTEPGHGFISCFPFCLMSLLPLERSGMYGMFQKCAIAPV